MIWFVVAATSLVAGIIQSVTGFGSVVFLMMILPFYFNMIDATALAIVINQLFCMVLCWKYRRHIQWRLTLPPTIAFSLASLLMLGIVDTLDLHVLVIVFAVFLVVLALYFLLAARRVQLTPKPAAGVVCGFFCGISAGLFAIGGPPMALYFVTAARDHASYLACMQLLFSITGAVSLFGRVYNGRDPALCGCRLRLHPAGCGHRRQNCRKAERRRHAHRGICLCGRFRSDPFAAADRLIQKKPHSLADLTKECGFYTRLFIRYGRRRFHGPPPLRLSPLQGRPGDQTQPG